MIYFIFGNDTIKSHQKFDEMMIQFSKEDENLSVFRFDEDSFDNFLFEDSLKANNLFGGKNLTVSKRLLSTAVSRDYVLDNLDKFSLSENIFLFWEEEIKKDQLKKIKKHTKDIFEFSSIKKDERKEMRNRLYRLTDLIAQRKRNDAWVLYQEEVFGGMSVEEIFWTVLWQIRSMLIAKKGGGKDLHPFVLKKAQRSAVLFKEEELKNYLGKLLDLYHKDRRGVGDLEIGLEKFILRV